MRPFDMVSPLDYRYNKELFGKLQPFASEEAFIRYQLNVETALVRVMSRWGVCSEEIAEEIENACERVRIGDVYAEEKRIKHSVRALANCIRTNVSERAKPFVHLSVTSSDITDTATAMRLRDMFKKVILPDLLELERYLIEMARDNSDLIQIGRTHGKFAEPITFGFAITKYVSRLADRIETIVHAAENLRGKISGAVGAYNALSLIVSDPEKFEKEVLSELGLKPATHSTQIVEPQFVTDLACAVTSCFSVLANLADDFRHLQRSEIQEIEELKEDNRVGSSTMPHKVNPWDFEHVKSMWKAFVPRIITVFMDEISEHQRDLTNSASSRFVTELFVAFDHSVNWTRDALAKIKINKDSVKRHVQESSKEVVAEPLYILLAIHGHPDAYEYVRRMATKARESGQKLSEAIWEDKQIRPYIEKMTEKQKKILRHPDEYTGIAKEKTESVCSYLEAALLL
ncbi:MAG: lyase family protein [Candidatus Bathyarchaeia archaeon]